MVNRQPEPHRAYKRSTAAKVTTTDAATEKTGGLVHRTEPHSALEIRKHTAVDVTHVVADAEMASGTGLTSATAKFDANDVGATVAGDGVADDTVIASVTNATTVVLDKSTTKTQGVEVTITRAALRYVALKPMKVNGTKVEPGTIVPEANAWRNLHNYISAGYLAVVGS